MTQWAWFINDLKVDNGLYFFVIFSVTTAKYYEHLLSGASGNIIAVNIDILLSTV